MRKKQEELKETRVEKMSFLLVSDTIDDHGYIGTPGNFRVRVEEKHF